VDPDPANKDKIIEWCKNYFDALHPYSAGGAYVNFMMEEGQERVRAAFRDKYDRLAMIKNRHDPANFFRVNQNVRPPGPQPASSVAANSVEETPITPGLSVQDRR